MSVRKIIKKIVDVNRVLSILRFVPDEKYLRIMYKLSIGKKLNLHSPKTFSEKIQWLKLYDRKQMYTTMVDKFEVKQYVASIIGEQYVIPNYGVWNRFEDIDFESLPEQFVIKCTHDSGGVVICKDKSQLDWSQVKKKIKRSFRTDFYWVCREWPYLNVKHRILAEKYMENDEKQGLHDYKVWCFNGEPKFIQYISGRQGETVESFYDVHWNKQGFCFHNPLMEESVAKPKRLEELLDLCRKLSAGIVFARVDFYVLEDESLRFGEITFYPMGGFEKWHPTEMDESLGEMIRLPQKEHV